MLQYLETNVQASAGREHIRNVMQLERWSKSTADVDFGIEGTMSRSSLPT